MKFAIYLTVLVCFSFLLVPLSSLAQESDPGLLPHSPFYFLKEWGRAIQKIFTLTSLGKAELALEISEAQIRELKKIQETIPDNIDAISRGLDKYVKNAAYLEKRVAKLLKKAGGSDADRFFNGLTSAVLEHQQLFDDLRAKVEFLSDLKTQLDQAQDDLTAVLAVVPDLARRVYLAVDQGDSPLKELRAAEVIDRLGDSIKGGARAEVFELKETLILKFSGRLESQAIFSSGDAVLPTLGETPGDQLRRLKILDEIRESVLNPDVKSQLNVIRQRILDKAAEVGAINSRRAELAVAEAEADLLEVESSVSAQAALPRGIKQLIERAKFSLNQAKDLLKQSNYGGAYGQATAASAALKNVVLQLAISVEDKTSDVEELKKQFDSLLARTKEENLSRAAYPKLFDLFADAEKKIAALPTAAVSSKESERFTGPIRQIRLILATIENLIDSLK